VHLLVCVTVTCLLAGCPTPTVQLPAYETWDGLYWVEYLDGTLSVFELPAYRGDEGRWLTFDTNLPAWYTGPALYEAQAGGTWLRLTEGNDLTLDDVLMLHDPAPPPPASGKVTISEF